jgi:hypothetical protein
MVSILINKNHRSNGRDKWLKNRKLHKDEKGLYIRYDKSTWYVRLNDYGVYESTEYRSYEG